MFLTHFFVIFRMAVLGQKTIGYLSSAKFITTVIMFEQEKVVTIKAKEFKSAFMEDNDK